MDSCLFCKIVRGERPATLLHEDERAVAFADINPQAPTHILVIPRKHISTLADAGDEDQGLLGHLLLVGAQLAREQGLVQRGFRTVINTNADAGQTVFHIHVHIIGGRRMGWPPG
jgi:histidine triad (HIT) family protein